MKPSRGSPTPLYDLHGTGKVIDNGLFLASLKELTDSWKREKSIEQFHSITIRGGRDSARFDTI